MQKSATHKIIATPREAPQAPFKHGEGEFQGQLGHLHQTH